MRLIFTDDVLHDHRPTLKIQAEGEEYPFSEYLTKLGEVVF